MFLRFVVLPALTGGSDVYDLFAVGLPGPIATFESKAVSALLAQHVRGLEFGGDHV